MEAMKSQKDWLDYINRLQDRERQKIASGGLNNWALYVALAGLGYWIFPDIVDMQKHWLTLMVGYTFFFHNTTISLFDIFNSHYRQKKIRSYYDPIALIDITGTIPLRFFQKIFVTIAITANIYLLIHTFSNDIKWLIPYFFLYFVRYISEFFTLMFPKLDKKWRKALLNFAEKANPDIV